MNRPTLFIQYHFCLLPLWVCLVVLVINGCLTWQKNTPVNRSALWISGERFGVEQLYFSLSPIVSFLLCVGCILLRIALVNEMYHYFKPSLQMQRNNYLTNRKHQEKIQNNGQQSLISYFFHAAATIQLNAFQRLVHQLLCVLRHICFFLLSLLSLSLYLVAQVEHISVFNLPHNLPTLLSIYLPVYLICLFSIFKFQIEFYSKYFIQYYCLQMCSFQVKNYSAQLNYVVNYQPINTYFSYQYITEIDKY